MPGSSTDTNVKMNIIQRLSLFKNDNAAQMVVNYLTEKFQIIDSLSIQVITDLIGKIEKWKSDTNLKNVQNSGYNLSDVMQAVSEILKDKVRENKFLRVEDHKTKINEEVNVSELINILKNGSLITRMNTVTLRIISTINDWQLADLVSALIEFPIAKPLTINTSSLKMAPSAARELARYLRSGKTPKELSLWLFANELDDDGIEYLTEAIESGHTKDKLLLNLNGNIISDAGIAYISNAISSGKMKTGFILCLDHKQTFSANAGKSLSDAIQSNHAPKGLSIWGGNLTRETSLAFANAIESGKAPVNLSLFFNQVTHETISPLITSIASGAAPKGLSLDISCKTNELNNKLGEDLVNALGSGKIPDRLTISLRQAEEIDTFIKMLVVTLKDLKILSNIKLSFSPFTKFNSQTFRLLIDFIKSDKYPKKCQICSLLDFQMYSLDKAEQETLADAMLSNTSIQMSSYIFETETLQKKFDIATFEKIRLCSLRNKLIADFPRNADFIKKYCENIGLYISEKNNKILPALQSMSAYTLFKNKGNIENYQEILGSLPQEVKDFIHEVETICNQLTPKTSP